VEPFVLGGSTRLVALTESGGNNALNIGAEINYWLGDDKGLRLEFRDVVYNALGTDQYWAVGIGIIFR
jgi:hypothetical protein